MYDPFTRTLTLEVPTKWGTGEATVSFCEEGLDLKVTDHSGRDTWCVYERDGLRSRSRSGMIRGERYPWVFEGPIYDALNPEVNRIAMTAIEEFRNNEQTLRT